MILRIRALLLTRYLDLITTKAQTRWFDPSLSTACKKKIRNTHMVICAHWLWDLGLNGIKLTMRGGKKHLAAKWLTQIWTRQRILPLAAAFSSFYLHEANQCSGTLIIGYIRFVLEGGFDRGKREREMQKCWCHWRARILKKDSNWVSVIMTGLHPIKLSHLIIKSHWVIMGVGDRAECLNAESSVGVLILAVRSDWCPVPSPSFGARFPHLSSAALPFTQATIDFDWLL